MNAAHYAGLWSQLVTMARSGHVDFNILEGRENPAREHQADFDESVRDQSDWDSDRWPKGGL